MALVLSLQATACGNNADNAESQTDVTAEASEAETEVETTEATTVEEEPEVEEEIEVEETESEEAVAEETSNCPDGTYRTYVNYVSSMEKADGIVTVKVNEFIADENPGVDVSSLNNCEFTGNANEIQYGNLDVTDSNFKANSDFDTIKSNITQEDEPGLPGFCLEIKDGKIVKIWIVWS